MSPQVNIASTRSSPLVPESRRQLKSPHTRSGFLHGEMDDRARVKSSKHRMAEVEESMNTTSELGVSFQSDKKRECKRMGKRIYGIRSFAYRIRMPQPHAAYLVYRILA